MLPLKRKVCYGHLLLLKSIASAGFDPANIGSNGKHDNDYTTEGIMLRLQMHRAVGLLPFLRQSS
jgi:hypothetical protein